MLGLEGERAESEGEGKRGQWWDETGRVGYGTRMELGRAGREREGMRGEGNTNVAIYKHAI